MGGLFLQEILDGKKMAGVASLGRKKRLDIASRYVSLELQNPSHNIALVRLHCGCICGTLVTIHFLSVSCNT